MQRNKKIVLLAHCILNVNAKVYGIATEPAGCQKIVGGLLADGYGIIQLPCVEQLAFGMRRWGQVREQMDFPAFRNKCRVLLQPIIEQVMDFYRNGYDIAAVIGLDGSPACGINYTASGDWGGEIGIGEDLPGKIASLHNSEEAGVMMQVLRQMLTENGLNITFLAVAESDPDSAYKDLLQALKHC